MNPDKPSREQIETRITALLLGELPAEEAELLRWTISQDPELQKLHARLLLTAGFVREALAHPADADEKSAPMKLSDERREKLLAHFKTPRPEFVMPVNRRKSFWVKQLQPPSLISLLVVVAIIALLAAMLLPSLSRAKMKARSTSQANATINNLRQIDAAVNEWALENKKSPTDVPTENDLKPYLVNGKLPPPVMGETYVLGSASEPTKADIAHTQAKMSGYLASRLPSGGAKDQVVQLSADGNVTVVDKPAQQVARINQATPAHALPGDERTINQAVGVAAITPPPPAPPAEIVLPKTESPSTAGAVYSQNVVGFASIQDNSSTPSAPPPSSSFDMAISGGGAQQSAIAKPQTATQPVASLDVFALRNGGVTKEFESDGDNGGRAGGGGAGGGDTYVVKSGDTLTKIARERGTTVEALQAANNLSTTKIRAGEKMKMPGEAETTAPAPQIQTPALAWDDSGVNRSVGLNAPQNLGEDYRGKVRTSTAAPAYTFSAENTVASTAPVNKKDSDQDAAWYLGAKQADAKTSPDTSNDRIVAQQNLQAQTSRSATDAESEKVPVLGDVPAAVAPGNVHFYSINAPAAPTSAPSSPFQQRLQGIVNRAATPSTAGGAVMFEFSGKGESTKSDNGTLTLNGNNSFASGTTINAGKLGGINRVEEPGQVINSGTLTTTTDRISAGDEIALNYARPSDVATPLQQLQKKALQSREQAQITPTGIVQITNAVVLYRDTFNSGLTRDDANGLRALLQTNAVALADSEMQKSQEMSARQRFYAQKRYAEPNAAPAATLKPQIQLAAADEDKSLPKTQLPPPIPQPEVLCRENNFSTFSLNVSDVSFKLAAASLEKGRMPDAASIRSEEFINAFDYRDPEAAAGQPLAFVSERARYPFAHNRDLLRFSVKTAAAGRPAGRALNLVLLLDNSGSMERADRVAIIREALRVLAAQLQPQDTVSVVTFARTARLWADGVSGDKAGETLKNVGSITPDGGTNLEEAMRLAYETARRHYLANEINRVVLLTDGAANLGDVSPADLKQKVEAQRKQGIALDCFGIGFEDFNDDLLEQLSSNGDGRYAFLNSPEDASKEFAAKLAGALQVAAQDVKVQVEFNPQRVISWRQIGYAKHQLTKEQFRDNTVDAAEIAAQEAGNALYTVETKPDGIGPIATVRVRYKVPGTTDYRERSWNADYAVAPALEQSSPAMRLAATASAFSEWLAASPFAQEVTLDELQKILNGVPQVYGADQRPAKLETMIREAKSISVK